MDEKHWTDRVEKKIDGILEELTKLNITAAKQEVNLTDHMRRTSLLEHAVEVLKTHVDRVTGGIILFVFLVGSYTFWINFLVK
jgi:hypothetical protein